MDEARADPVGTFTNADPVVDVSDCEVQCPMGLHPTKSRSRVGVADRQQRVERLRRQLFIIILKLVGLKEINVRGGREVARVIFTADAVNQQ